MFSSSESAEPTAVEVESTATDLSSSASSHSASSTIMTSVDILSGSLADGTALESR